MANTKMTSYISITLLISLTSSLFFASYSVATSDGDAALNSQIADLKLKLDNLEHLFERIELELDTKGTYILKCEKQIEELGRTIHQLESTLSNIEEPPEYEQVINVYEKQVQELEASVRSNNKELQQLKRKVKDSENRVDLLAAQVKTMAVIVSELWLHIQKLDQAQEVIERRTAELRTYMRNQKCSFFKFINSFGGRQYHKVVAPYTSKALSLLKRSLLAVKKYHHQLQGVVKREMDKHELTAVLAGEESVFLLWQSFDWNRDAIFTLDHPETASLC